MTPHEMQLLFAYNDWANKRALQAASTLTPEQFTKPLGNSFSRFVTRSCTCTAPKISGSSASGVAAAFPDRSQFTDIASLEAKWTPAAADLLNFVSGLTQEDIDASSNTKR